MASSTTTVRSTRLQNDLLERVDALAETEERNFNWVVRKALEAYLDAETEIDARDTNPGDRIRIELKGGMTERVELLERDWAGDTGSPRIKLRVKHKGGSVTSYYVTPGATVKKARG